jgi:hypothetical protein
MAVGDVFPKMLKAPTLLGTSTTTVFTVTTNYQWTVKQIIICNTDSIERLVTLAYDATAATASNCFVYRLPIAAGDTIILDTGLVFESADTLQGLCDTADKVTVCATGWERQVA